MRRVIKIILCFIVICIQVAIELYPMGELLVKKQLSEVNFKSALNAKPIAQYVSFLAEEEKKNLASTLEGLFTADQKK